MKLTASLALLLLATSCASMHAPSHVAQHPIRVLIVGGGTAHDFARWYGQADAHFLDGMPDVAATYTEDVATLADHLKNVDVLILATNNPIDSHEARAALMEFPAPGRGVILAHAGLWFNQTNWPAYNQVLAGGGARVHDALSTFTLSVLPKRNAITYGLPATLHMRDELYHYVPSGTGPGIDTFVEARARDGQTYPLVFSVHHPQGRIIGIALGHDGSTHNSDAYKHMLDQAVHWVASPE